MGTPRKDFKASKPSPEPLHPSFRTDEAIKKELRCLEAQEMRRLRGSEQWLETFMARMEGCEVLAPGWEPEKVEDLPREGSEGGAEGLETEPEVIEAGSLNLKGLEAWPGGGLEAFRWRWRLGGQGNRGDEGVAGLS